MIPTAIDRFEIKGELGKGAMGTVFLAFDPAMDRLVALKLLSINTEEFRARFRREAIAGGRLSHKNIVTFHEPGVYDGQPFLVTEYIKGETLAELIGRKAPLTLDKKLKLMEELCDGLGYAHDANLIHRDIKPANLMVREGSGALTILDFGIARALDQSGLTQVGTVMGTVNYMSPEQALGHTLDLRSDIFSVGAVLYGLLTYRRAFPGSDWQAVLQESPPPVTESVPQLDPDLDDIVAKALAPDPAHRYQHLHELGERLAQIRTKVEASTSTSRQAGSVDAVLRVAADAKQYNEYLSSARDRLAQGDPTTAMTLVNRALDVQRTPAGIDLQKRVLLALEKRETELGHTTTIEHSLRAAGDNLAAGAFESAIRAATEVLAYDPEHQTAIELTRLAHEGLEKRGTSERVTADKTSAPPTETRWRVWLVAAAVVAAIAAGTSFVLTRSTPAERAVAEAVALYEAGQIREANALLEAFDPPDEGVDEQLADLRARREREARDLATRARGTADLGAVDNAITMLKGFNPPHEVVTTLLSDLQGTQNIEETAGIAVEAAEQHAEAGEWQEAFARLASAPEHPMVEAAHEKITTDWEQAGETLADRATTMAEGGDRQAALAALNSFLPPSAAVNAALSGLRSAEESLVAAQAAVALAQGAAEEEEWTQALDYLDATPAHPVVEFAREDIRARHAGAAGVLVGQVRSRVEEADRGDLQAAIAEFEAAIAELEGFAPTHASIQPALSDLGGDLDRLAAAQTAVNLAQQRAANGEWTQALTGLEDFTQPDLVADALTELHDRWLVEGEKFTLDAQTMAEVGNPAGALARLTGLPDHPSVNELRDGLSASINAPPVPETTEERPADDNARNMALATQAEEQLARFVKLYEELDLDGMTRAWPRAARDFDRLSEAFRNLDSNSVQSNDCDAERTDDYARAVANCAVVVTIEPKAGGDVRLPPENWRFDFDWVDGRWDIVGWSR